MSNTNTFEDMAFDKVPDPLDRHDLIKKHEEEIEEKAQKIAESKAEGILEAKKGDYQLEVLKQLQEEGLHKEGMKISASSPLISETFTVGGLELQPSDFIPNSVATDPLYEEKMLIRNAYSLEWQEQDRNTGKRKFICICDPTSVLIANPQGIGRCENIIVTLKGEKKPLIFPGGDISYESFRKQTRFLRKGLKADARIIYEAFLRAIRECPCKLFLTIPKHAGWVKLQSGDSIYISSESVIPGLEELFPTEVRGHKLIHHELPLEVISAMYSAALPNNMEAKLLTTIRTSTCLLPFYEAEGLRPDRGFVAVYNSESAKEACVALTKRQNYKTTVTSSISERISRIRTYFETSNDSTVVLSSSGIIDDSRSIHNGLKAIYENLNRTNGIEDNTRKFFVMLTDSPGSFPEDFPAYYTTCELSLDTKNIEIIQRFAGMLDYALIEFAGRNPDATKQLVCEGIKFARGVVTSFKNTEVTDSMIMTLATAHILSKLHIISDIEMQSIIHWFRTEATSRLSMSDSTCCEFKSAVSNAILNGELKIAKQTGPPYYKEDGHTAFIREEDKSINMSDDTIKNIIIPQVSTRSVTKMNKHLNAKGLLKGKHTNKRKLKVAYEAGVFEDVEVFSYSRSVINAEAKAYVDDIIDNEYWFNVGEYPEDFVPVLYDKDGTKAAGYVFKPDDDDNLHEVYFGYTRSGKTFALTNRAIQKVEAEGSDAVIILDQTGGSSVAEVDKHIGKELRMKYFTFWNVYENGVPVNLLDCRGSLTYKEKKERITRIYAMMTRSLGNYQEQILKNAVKSMLYDMKKNPDITIFDILQYIVQYNEEGEPYLDEAHKKLRCKLQAVLDELEDTPQNKNSWGEFLKEQGKPIVVISTGADSVGKGSEIIDIMLESLYTYKQCHPCEKYSVIIDEAQDLYLHEKGTVNVLLRKGGKHNITMLLASQSFPDPNIQFGKVVGNCGRLRSYHPKADDLKRAANYFSCDKDEVDFLKQGECYDKGLFWSRYRSENVITTLKGKTVAFELDTDINSKTEEGDEQP